MDRHWTTWSGVRLLGISVLGAMLAVVAAGASLLYTERAVVKLSLPSKHVAVTDAVLNGSAPGALATTQLTASVTESQTGTSSSISLPASNATGWVKFWCSPMTSCPSGYTVAAGTILQSVSGVRYATESSASFPSCAPSSMIAVYALTPGSPGNAGAGAVVYGQFPGYIHVTNPGAVAGGADPRTVSVVQQSQIDALVAPLQAKVAGELAAQLKSSAGKLDYFTAGAPSFTVTSDHRAGDNAATFTVSVAGTLQATAFAADAARAVLLGDLERQSPAGYGLVKGSFEATYSLQAGSVVGSASGLITPAIDPGVMATSLRGLNASQAETWLQERAPGATLQIQTSPVGMPRLPLLTDHITIVVAGQG